MPAMAKKPGQKKRVEFRQNRQQRRRTDDWTQRFREGDETLQDTHRGESVRPKGDLSRKRTIIVDDADLPAGDAALQRSGTVVKVHGLIAYVDDGEHVWPCTVRRILRTMLIESRSPVTTGDHVWISDQSAQHGGARVGVIERVEPRRTVLSRRDARGRQHAIVANAEQLLMVVSVAQPRLRPHLVDRYIVAALKGRLRPVVCFNKIDLLDDDTHTEIDGDEPRQGGLATRAVIDEFRGLGYTCVCTSTLTGAGIAEARAALQGRITVLSGQSGVGKSSLINAIEPGMELRTQLVSTESEKGRHTTTHAELYALTGGGYVVDTPGIRAFELWSVTRPELEALFEEFVPFVPHCRYSDCYHRDEEECAVRAAVEAGRISERRYSSYVKMLEDAS